MALGSIENTPLWNDVKATILSGPKVVKSNYFVMIHTAEADFPILKLIQVEEYCHYEANLGPSMSVHFQLGLGDYTYKLYPFRANLEVSVKKIPQKEDGGDDMEEDVPVVRYKAVLTLGMNPEVTGTKIADKDYQTLNTSNLVTVQLDLQDRDFEPLRLKTFPGGTFRNLTVKDIIYTCLLGESRNVLVDGKPPVDGIDIVDPDNTKRIANLIIPSGMRAAMIPSFLQEKSHGVYNSGLGTFFQRYNGEAFWFVYSLYDPTRFEDDVGRMVIFSVPKDKLPGIDRTYRQDGKIVYVVATGDRSFRDTGNIVDVNEGIGFRMTDAGAMMRKPVIMTEEGPKADRARLNTEVAGRERADGNYFSPVVTQSVNPFIQLSSLAQRQLGRLEIAWENSDPDLIYPGMPIKYVFMDKNEYRECRGVIIGKYSTTGIIGTASVSNSYRTTTHISAMVEQYTMTPDEMPKMDSPGKF